MKKKHRGSISSIFSIVEVVIFMIIFVWAVSWFSPLALRISVGNIYRDYKIEMAKDGCLTSDNRQSLINNLTNEGCKNIKIIATDSKVKWGEEVQLKIEYDTTYKTLGREEGDWFLSLKDKQVKVTIDDKKLISLTT